MSDQDTFERFVSDHVADDGSGVVEARRITAGLGELIDQNRQRPRWLALIKEDPMRYESRLAAGSPAVRAAAILAATTLIALAIIAAGVAGQRLLAADAAIIVAQDGSGDHETIGAAIAAAPDGAEIHVRPARYIESVAIVGKDLTIVGAGERNKIILELDPDATPLDIDWSAIIDDGDDAPINALLIHMSRSSVSGLTVLAPDDWDAITVVGTGAEAHLRDIDVRSLGEIPGGINAVFWEDGASGSLSDSHVEGWVGLGEDTTVTLERNMMPATCVGVWADGADIVIRDNVIHGCPFEKGLEIEGGNTVLIEGNDIMAEEVEPGPSNPAWGGREGIQIFGQGASVTIRDNDIHGSAVGIDTVMQATVVIADNRIRDNDGDGIVRVPDGAIVSGNTISGNGRRGVTILNSAPTIDGNEISGNDVGLFLGPRAAPTLSGNTICDNATDVEIVNASETPPTLDGNEICGEITTS